jgi:outer membrane protein
MKHEHEKERQLAQKDVWFISAAATKSCVVATMQEREINIIVGRRIVVTYRIRSRSDSGLKIGARLYRGCLLAALCCGRVFAQEQSQTGQGQPPVQEQELSKEIAITAERQTELQSEALIFSETPDAGPRTMHAYTVVGLVAMFAPAYDGSKKTRIGPFPYVDIRGLFDDRVFVSITNGIGLKVLNDGPVKAGVTVNYSGGRTSSDDPRLKGLPDVGGAAQAGGFITCSFRPFAFEAQVGRRLGSKPGTTVQLDGSVSAALLPQFHVSLSADLTWADSGYQKTFFGVTAAEAAQATSKGNPLTAYTPGSGLTMASLTAAAVFQLREDWELIARISLQDLVGTPARNSPLTQRTFQTVLAFGAIYNF